MIAAQALRDAIIRLTAAGIPDAARDGRRLLAHALGISPDRLVLFLQDELDHATMQRFDRAIHARQSYQPVAQIIGTRLFWGRSFRVTQDTLDPRPETEILVDLALQSSFDTVLDLGTGTGAILLSVLGDRPMARGLGVDISAAAVKVARENAMSLGIEAEFLQSDWFSGVTGTYDLILSNPPYIALAEMADLAPDVRDWEPHLALTDGADGLGAYHIIAQNCQTHLTPKGRVMVEIGPTQGADVCAIFQDSGAVETVITPDWDGRDRVVSARFSAKNG